MYPSCRVNPPLLPWPLACLVTIPWHQAYLATTPTYPWRPLACLSGRTRYKSKVLITDSFILEARTERVLIVRSVKTKPDWAGLGSRTTSVMLVGCHCAAERQTVMNVIMTWCKNINTLLTHPKTCINSFSGNSPHKWIQSLCRRTSKCQI